MRHLSSEYWDHWDNRQTPELSLRTIFGKLRAIAGSNSDARIIPFVPPPIPGLDQRLGFEFVLQIFQRQPRGS